MDLPEHRHRRLSGKAGDVKASLMHPAAFRVPVQFRFSEAANSKSPAITEWTVSPSCWQANQRLARDSQ